MGAMITVTKLWESTQSNELWDEIVEWCIQQFGNNAGRWQSQATVWHMDFYFSDEQDAELFILKWM